MIRTLFDFTVAVKVKCHRHNIVTGSHDSFRDFTQFRIHNKMQIQKSVATGDHGNKFPPTQQCINPTSEDPAPASDSQFTFYKVYC